MAALEKSISECDKCIAEFDTAECGAKGDQPSSAVKSESPVAGEPEAQTSEETVDLPPLVGEAAEKGNAKSPEVVAGVVET